MTTDQIEEHYIKTYGLYLWQTINNKRQWNYTQKNNC
jgi:hypothetical protein